MSRRRNTEHNTNHNDEFLSLLSNDPNDRPSNIHSRTSFDIRRRGGPTAVRPMISYDNSAQNSSRASVNNTYRSGETQPLLNNDPAFRTNAQSRKRFDILRGGPAVVPLTASAYNPSRSMKTSYNNSAQMLTVQGEDLVPEYAQTSDLYLDVPSPHSLSRSIRRQSRARTFHRERTGMDLHGTNNPVQELTSFWSHGCFCFQCVRTQEVGIIEDFRKFRELLGPGLYCFCWPFSNISGRLSLRIQQLDVKCETKTKDDVFINLSVCVQYRVIAEKAYDAYYRLTDPRSQISSYVFDVIRSTVPRMEVDEAFTSKSDIALSISKHLQKLLHDYGYEILETLVTDILPDPVVKASMNEINASKRIKEAMEHRAEAEKVKKIKAAEAHAETIYLSGIGLARKRKSSVCMKIYILLSILDRPFSISPHLHNIITSCQAIASGFKSSLSQDNANDMSSTDIINVILLSQYYETLQAITPHNMMLQHSPGVVPDVQNQVSSNYFSPVAKKEADVIDLIPDLLS